MSISWPDVFLLLRSNSRSSAWSGLVTRYAKGGVDVDLADLKTSGFTLSLSKSGVSSLEDLFLPGTILGSRVIFLSKVVLEDDDDAGSTG